MPTDSTSQTHLLRLPQELLDQILEHVVQTIKDPDVGERYAQPALLQACHHLRNSTAPIFYAQKPIVFNRAVDMQAVGEIFGAFDPAHKKYVKRVICVWYFNGPTSREMAKDLAKRLDGATGLQAGTWAFGCESESDRSVVDYVNARGKRCGVRDRWARTQAFLPPGFGKFSD